MAVAQLDEYCIKCNRSYPKGSGKCPYCGYEVYYPHRVEREITDQEIRTTFRVQDSDDEYKNDLNEHYIILVDGQELRMKAPYLSGDLALPKSREFIIMIKTVNRGKTVLTREDTIIVPEKLLQENNVKEAKSTEEDYDDDWEPQEAFMFVDLSAICVEYKKGLFSKGKCGSLKVIKCW